MKTTDYKFSNPYIKESVFVLNDEFNNEQNNGITIRTTTSSYTSYQPEQADNSAICGLTVCVGERGDGSPFYAKVTMEAMFSWDNKTVEELNTFFSVNAPTLLTGYIRPVLTYLTANSPYPPFHLSFINFAE